MTLAVQSYKDLAEYFHASVDPEVEAFYKPRYNIAPMSAHLVLRMHDGQRQIVPARWGLINYWAKDRSVGSRQINARSETARTKPAYREAFERRRCVIPADGFYEWEGPKGARRPLWFHPKAGGLLTLAGLYETWKDPASGEPVRTFTVLTTAANDFIARIHDRMPAILMPEDVDRWLATPEKGDPSNAEQASELLKPAPNDALVARPVSTQVNSVGVDAPELICEAREDAAAAQAEAPPKAAAKRKKAASPVDDMPLFANLKRGA
jgi:putative SOS response-associated peptidase YedK